MTDERLEAEVRALRAKGRSPKEIARALGVRPAAVADLVRRIAAEQAATEPAQVNCLVSPGWDIGLTFDGHPDWPSDPTAAPPASGLVCVLVSREERNRRLAVTGYLLDVYCLGVKNTIGPRRMPSHEQPAFAKSFFSAWDRSPRPIPVDLARDLVFGAAAYATSLGFPPHPDFALARRELEPWDGPSAIRFGRDGRPFYHQGPYDDAHHVLRTLEAGVGRGNFHYVVSTPLETAPARRSERRHRRAA